MGKDECIKLLKKYMTILKDKYGITSLSLFGSTARGEQTVDGRL
jgi:predicted nucleotidyltransferase